MAALLPLGASVARMSGRQALRNVQRTSQLKLQMPTPLAIRSFSGSTKWSVKKYTADHEWIDIPDGGDTGTMGVTKYAAHALGDVVYVELPTVDQEVTKGEAIGAVESVKSASDIMTPVTGTIVAVNGDLETKPGSINKDPEGGAWLAKIRVADAGELEGLMDAQGYEKFTEEASAE